MNKAGIKEEIDMAKRFRQPVSISCVKVSGALDKRIRLGLRHLLSERGRILEEGHTQGWGADGVGRWVYAVSQTAACTGEAIPELDEMVKELINVQGADGAWGQGDWGNSRAIIGLSEYWDVTRNAAALASVKKAGNYYLRKCEDAVSQNPANPPFYPRGGIESLMVLWRVTGESRYLEAAETAAAYANRNHVFLVPDIHMHCDFLTPLRGFAELFLATGKRKYLAIVQGLYIEVLQKEMWVTGGICENRDYVFESRDETCQVSDWLRLSLRLWQATGEAMYMEAAEHTLLNHLYFNQDHTGGFCTYRSFGISPITSFPRDFVAWFCCSMHGLRALLEAVMFIYTNDEDSIDINLYTPSEARIAIRDGHISLKQVTDYPSAFTVRVNVEPEREIPFCLRLRIPHWARSCQMTLNSELIKTEAVGGYVAITRTWKAGDRVEVSFEADLRVVPDGVNGFAMTSTASTDSVKTAIINRGALIYGPLVLMVDPVLNTHNMYDWDQIEILVPRLTNSELFLPRVEVPVPGRREFSVPGMCFMTLGRNVRQIEKRDKSIFDPDLVNTTPENARSEQPDPKDESWKLVFLVPVSEITDRWTSTLHRIVPYEVRNNLWLLEETQTDALLARTRSLLESVRTEKWLKTSGYLMRLAGTGTNR